MSSTGQIRPKATASKPKRLSHKCRNEHLMLCHSEFDLDKWEKVVLERGLSDEYLVLLLRVLRETVEEQNDRIVVLENKLRNVSDVQTWLEIN